jgi:hypothetical protein
LRTWRPITKGKRRESKPTAERVLPVILGRTSQAIREIVYEPDTCTHEKALSSLIMPKQAKQTSAPLCSRGFFNVDIILN